MTAVLVTGLSSEATALVSALRAAALRVHAVPTIELAPIPASSTAGRRLRQTFMDLCPADWVMVTSVFGARVAARHFLLADGLSYAPVRWAALGSAAARSLAAAGIQPDVRAPVAQPGVAVERMAAGGGLVGQRVIVARSDVADASLPQLLVASGAEVQAIATYRTIEGPSWARSALHRAVSDPALQAIVVTSGSAARGLIRVVDGDSFWPRRRTEAADRVRALPTVTIGPATSAAAGGAGLRVAAEADEPTVKGIVDAVARAVAMEPTAPTESGATDR